LKGGNDGILVFWKICCNILQKLVWMGFVT
jgi:hypothetical protein